MVTGNCEVCLAPHWPAALAIASPPAAGHGWQHHGDRGGCLLDDAGRRVGQIGHYERDVAVRPVCDETGRASGPRAPAGAVARGARAGRDRRPDRRRSPGRRGRRAPHRNRLPAAAAMEPRLRRHGAAQLCWVQRLLPGARPAAAGGVDVDWRGLRDGAAARRRARAAPGRRRGQSGRQARLRHRPGQGGGGAALRPGQPGRGHGRRATRGARAPPARRHAAAGGYPQHSQGLPAAARRAPSAAARVGAAHVPTCRRS